MEIIQGTKKITKAEDVRNDNKMLMKPYANWEEFLMPAPISIAILGELVFISSNTDFSINKNPPKDGFKFIRYPESFRACLMQVCNAGWGAFNEAHKNMDQIRLHSANVPEYVKLAVKLIVRDDDKLIELMLPDQLENISSIAEECKILSELTEKKFTFVIDLIQELMEACLNAKAAYSEELEELKQKIEESKLRKQTAEEGKRRANKTFENMQKQLDEAQQEYKKAMDSLPSGWDIVGMNFVEGLTNLVNICYSACTASVTKRGRKTSKEQNPIALGNVYAKSQVLLSLLELVKCFFHEDKIHWGVLYDQKKECAKSEWVADQVKRVKESLEKEEDCKPKITAMQMCEDILTICSCLTDIAPDNVCEESKQKELITKLKKLKTQAMKFDTESKGFTGASAFPVTPPQLAKHQEEQSTQRKSAGDVAADNARFRIEQSRAQMNQAQQMFQKSLENLDKYHSDLTEILVTMRSCEVKEIDFKTTIKMLTKGLDAMGKVKEQWEKMVFFFHMLSNIIKTNLNKHLKDVVQTAEKAGSSKLGYSAKSFLRDLLYNQAFQASNIASLVNMISGTYTEISNLYLMDRISSLGKLMALDPSKSDFDTERKKLHIGCEEAEAGIKTIVLKNKIEFERNTKSRTEKIEKALNGALPPASEEEIKEVIQCVEVGMKMSTQEEEDEGQYC
ncbi:myosin-2 heavy chain-like [Lepisosteus oculatus]|uniref:myosin-2 heavy chain-like n=1 Tax=Lepisosteus oculatus TaxID=7918 RepID=UPI0035F52CD1